MSARIPRGLLVVLCALIIAGPASLVLAGTYRFDDSNRVKHRHTGDYTVFNAIGSVDSALQTRTENARSQWNTKLKQQNPDASSGLASGLRMSTASSQTNAAIKLDRYDFGDANAAIMWAAGYHPSSRTDVAFDSSRTLNWSGTEKEGKTCQVLGYIVGLDDAPISRADCMYDPLQYTGVKTESVEMVDKFYGPNVDLAGSMVEAKDGSSQARLQPGHTYELETHASGHSLAKVEFFIDGSSTPVQSSTAVSTSGCSPAVAETCIDSTLSRKGSELGAGQHTIKVVVTNSFGQKSDSTLDVFVEPSATGILRQYSFETEQLWDRGTARVNVVNGNLVFEQADLSIAGTTLNLQVNRFYNSLSNRTTDLGPGWAIDTASGIELKELATGDIRFHGPSGYDVRFKKSGTSFETPSGIDAGLTTQSGGGWNLDLYQSEERYVFDAQGRFDKHVNQKSGQEIDFVYGAANGKLSQIKDTQNRVITFEYWTTTNTETGAYNGRLKQIVDNSGRTWRYGYDAQGRLKFSQLLPSSGGEVASQTSYGYNGSGLLSTITDPKGVVTTIDYDSSNRVSAITRPVDTVNGETDAEGMGYKRSFAYQTPAQTPEKCLKNPAKPTEKEEDYELTLVTSPRGNETSTAGDYLTTYCHDGKNRVGQVVDANDKQQNIEWSTQSNVQSYSSGSGATTSREYTSPSGGSDPARLSRIAAPGGAVTKLSYTGASSTTFNATQITDPQQNVTKFGYEGTNGTGNLTSIRNGADEPLVTLDYFKATDGTGELKGLLKSSTLYNENSGVKNSGGDQKTTYQYDDQGNLTAEIPPGGGLQGTTRYEYDSLSRVKAVTDGNGERREISYDLQDRTKLVHYTPSASNKPQQFDTCLTYDKNGNLLQRLDDCGSTGRVDTYGYNLRNMRILDDLGSTGGNRQTDYLYDPDGNLRWLEFVSPNEGYIFFEHDEVNLMTKVIDAYEISGNGSPYQRITQYAYSDDYQPDLITFPNGVQQKFEYRTVPDTGDQDNDGEETEPTGQVSSIKAWNSAASLSSPNLMELMYDYDKPPYQPNLTTPESEQTTMRTRVRDLHGSTDLSTVYGYDQYNRIETVKEGQTGSESTVYEYLYDKASNIKELTDHGQKRSFEHNVVNEITCSYTGVQQASCPTGAKTYDYDANGNLKQVLGGGPSYGYDKRNRTTSMMPQGASMSTSFDYADYSQSERIARGGTQFSDTVLGTQVEASSSGRSIYVRTDSGQPIAIRRSLGDKTQDSYLLADSLGSTQVVTNSAGQEVARYGYSPYGETVSGGSTGPYNPFRFAGQYLDTETGHYKMGVRYYDPATQRWTQKDPLNLFQDPRQANRYVYAGGDPVNNVDPSGMFLDGCLAELVGLECFGIDDAVDTVGSCATGGAAGAAGGYVVGKTLPGEELTGGAAAIAGGVGGCVASSVETALDGIGF